MATIEEHQNSMTLFYSKQTSEIKSYATGIQDMNYFGINKIDFEIIYDFIVVERDEYVISNLDLFKVTNNKVILKENIDLSKYINQGGV